MVINNKSLNSLFSSSVLLVYRTYCSPALLVYRTYCSPMLLASLSYRTLVGTLVTFIRVFFRSLFIVLALAYSPAFALAMSLMFLCPMLEDYCDLHKCSISVYLQIVTLGPLGFATRSVLICI